MAEAPSQNVSFEPESKVVPRLDALHVERLAKNNIRFLEQLLDGRIYGHCIETEGVFQSEEGSPHWFKCLHDIHVLGAAGHGETEQGARAEARDCLP